jgi:ABC-type transport system involved in multi-copper enzyme maturation permease subunit
VNLDVNPIVVRELRGGLRSMRRISLLTFFLFVVGLFLLLVYNIAASTLESNGYSGSSSSVGSTFFPVIVGVELFFVCLITPAQTAGALVGERERQTYDCLLVTPLSPWRIVVGKLVAGLAYVALLLLAALPLQSMAFLMGGVGFQELMMGVVFLFTTMLAFGCLGLCSSAWFRTSRGASGFAYLVTGLLTLGIPVLSVMSSMLSFRFLQRLTDMNEAPPPWMIYIGEVIAATNPWIAAGLTEAQLQAALPLFWFTETIGKTKLSLPGPWLVFMGVYAAFSAFLLWNTARMVRTRRAS